MSTYNFQIDTQCPQCGAPVVLDETECIIQCRFCRTRNIIHTLPYPCYYMEVSPEKTAGSEVYYVPYWRFKGLEFSLGEKKPDFRVVDHSYIAVEISGLPVSLGLRSQTQKLKFIRKDIAGSFFAPAISREDIFKKMGAGDDKKVHIGEILSLIFMPFFLDEDTLYDGLTGKTMTLNPLDLIADKQSPAYHLKFTPSICPNCGWDLKGETDSLVLHCSNCMSSWLIHNKKLNKLKAMFYDLKPDTDMLVPFWRLEIEFKTLDCSTHAHLIKIANIPKVITKANENQTLYFYIPAFKLNPKLFLRIGRQTTLVQIEPTEIKKMPNIRFHPVNLPIEEGFQAVLPILMDLCNNKKEIWNLLAKEKLKLKRFSLTYFSFRICGSECIQDTLGFSLPINSLKFGRI